MHLGRAAVAAAVTTAQVGTVLPDSYCNPQCPSCKREYSSFDVSTSCLANSTFIVNCGSCQQCIWTYAVENPGLPNMELLEKDVQIILNFCLDSPASSEISALASQASRISALASVWPTNLSAPASTAVSASQITRTITGADGTMTWTGAADPSWTTVLSTATWASDYYAWQSAESSASAAASRYNQTVNSKPTITAAPTFSTATQQATGSAAPLNRSWVAGPVIGSILGMVTVFVVIYFTRQRIRHETMPVEAEVKDIKDEEDDSGDSTQGKSQLHGESVEMRELADTGVHEMPAAEPVGSELNTPRDGAMDPIEDWPLPMSPLPLLFAMTEMRDERTGNNSSPKHDTYYNP